MRNIFKLKGRTPKSQVAVLITLVLAFIILFAVIGINIAQVGEIKNMTSKAVDTAALKMASTLGSMAKNYKETIMGGSEDTDICEVDWIKIGLIIAAILAVLILPSFGVSAIALISFSVFLGGGFSVTAFMQTISSSRAIQSAIYDRFSTMSKYNAVREEALFSTLASLQTDDKLVDNIGGLQFRDSTTGQTYDLSEIREVDLSNQKYVGRFFAWYFSRRLPLVDEAQLREDTETFMTALSGSFAFEDWDSVRWNYTKVSLILQGGGIVTTSTAPDWVFGPGQVIGISIDETDMTGDRYNPSGYLVQVFDTLAPALDGDFGGISFCSSFLGLGWFATCDGISLVEEDLTDTLAKYKYVAEMPESDRMGAITQWFSPQFYDLNYTHDEVNGGTHDVYDRLTRDQVEIDKWIDELRVIDNDTIRPKIASAQGECIEGRGALCCGNCDRTRACSTPDCGCHYCEAGCCCNTCCYNPGLCAFRGNYLTCCQNPPVCSGGDMYGKIPGWCVPGAHDPCASGCAGCSVNNHDCGDDTSDYQGTMSYTCTGCLTEVGQAIAVLEALKVNIASLKTNIQEFAAIVQTYVDTSSPLRSSIDYAWKGKDGRNHYVSATIANYPLVFPHVEESREFYNLIRCLKFVGSTNYDPANGIDDPFIIWAGRYDQDMPTGWWNLRYRRSTDLAEYPIGSINAVINEIVTNGQLSEGSRIGLSSLYTDYMIGSYAKGYYGPEKNEIRIEKY